jgi:hypothetical protein
MKSSATLGPFRRKRPLLENRRRTVLQPSLKHAPRLNHSSLPFLITHRNLVSLDTNIFGKFNPTRFALASALSISVILSPGQYRSIISLCTLVALKKVSKSSAFLSVISSDVDVGVEVFERSEDGADEY